MVEIIHSPVKQLIIMEYIRFPNAEELVKNMILQPGQPAVLYWAEGVIFLPIPVPANNTKVIEELLNGRTYWMSVSYALMPTYSTMISAEKGPEALVINVSRSHLLSQVARWLKERPSSDS